VRVGQGIANKYFRETKKRNRQKLVEWKNGKQEKQECFKAPPQDAWYEMRTAVNNREPLFRRRQAMVIFCRVFGEAGRRFTFELCGFRAVAFSFALQYKHLSYERHTATRHPHP
jgi:hypothetical protein